MLTIKMRTENAAFEPEAGSEVARILRQVADAAERGGFSKPETYRLFDVNGNTVGEAVWK